jgi:hypothetical protein
VLVARDREAADAVLRDAQSWSDRTNNPVSNGYMTATTITRA